MSDIKRVWTAYEIANELDGYEFESGKPTLLCEYLAQCTRLMVWLRDQYPEENPCEHDIGYEAAVADMRAAIAEGSRR